MKGQIITLSHGGGGRESQSLIDSLFVEALGNPLLAPPSDSALLTIGGVRLAFTTDSYTVDPIFFPGGDIGALAVHGTVNDLAVAGARPLYLSLAMILEEGLAIADLQRITASIARAAREADVHIVTGDTKVVPRGKADKLYINTAGVGAVTASPPPSPTAARPGDRILVSGTLGDHGATILACRSDLGLDLDIHSDTAPLHALAARLLACGPVHCMKDPTRGGLGSSLNELAAASGVGIELDEQALPVAPGVRGVCEILGLDPLLLASEGRLLAVVPPEAEATALAAMRADPRGRGAAVIGRVTAEPAGLVLIRTSLGGRRVLDMNIGEALPRIC